MLDIELYLTLLQKKSNIKNLQTNAEIAMREKQQANH